ncbi:MAG: hypothetical protein E7672_08550 [Ruminococcaceae bacterium]|nr:hypothetical protein [Oscillospiraceae bacterium]
MKRNRIVTLLIAVGTALLLTSLSLTINSTANKSIIGGADFPTFLFIFSSERGGLYLALTCAAIIIIIAALIVHFTKNKTGRK